MQERRYEINAEMVALGCCTLSQKAGRIVAGILRPEMFFSPAHRRIAEAMMEIVAEGLDPDLVVLRNRIGKDLDFCGGIDYLIEITESAVSHHQAGEYARIVLREWQARQVRDRAMKIAKALNNRETESEGYTQAARLLNGVMDEATEIFDVSDVIARLRKKEIKGVASGFASIDDSLPHGGFPAGGVSYVCAAKGVGKSLMLCQIVRHVCSGPNRAFIASLEMPAEDLMRRVVYQMTGYWSIQHAERFHDGPAYEAALRDCDTWDLCFRDASHKAEGGDYVEDILQRADAEMMGRPIDVLLVDYFQLLNTREPGDRWEKLIHVSRKLRGWARRTGVPVVAAAQLNLGEGEPYIRGCREAENDAEMVTFLLLNRKDKTYTLAMEKSRHGSSFFEVPFELDRQRLLLRPVVPPDVSHVYRGDAAEARGGAA